MKKHTTFKIGGNTPLFISPNSKEKIVSIVNYLIDNNIDFLTVGNGSNLLVCDENLSRVVLCIGRSYSHVVHLGEGRVEVSSGTILAKLCSFALDNSLSGLEFAFGIPGCLGGALYINAGAYGGEMKDVVESVEYIDESGKLVRLYNNMLDFSYRHSFFKGKKNIILSAIIKLHTADKDKIKAKMDEFSHMRTTKQPIEFPSAGSTFLRPKNHFAAALIEQAGLKGLSVGGACVSEKHSGFIINNNNATCNDVLILIDIVKKRVLEHSGVELETEVIYVDR